MITLISHDLGLCHGRKYKRVLFQILKFEGELNEDDDDDDVAGYRRRIGAPTQR